MKIREIQTHNYRSIADQTIRLGDYSLLIGANNSGKSNALDALRTIYEKELKFDPERDLPKFPTADKETWLEIEYELSDDEAGTLKTEYLIGKNRFRIRKWLYPSDKAKLGLVGYENGKLSDSKFYGFPGVGQGKLGDVIYIPAVSRLEEHTKLTGPSALRDLINDILKPIIKSSAAFRKLSDDFGAFGKAIKAEETTDKRSLSGLEEKVNKEIEQWDTAFNLAVVSPQDEDIVKNLIKHTITDKTLKQEMESGAFGHGFQRHLIYTLIRIASSYTAPKPEPKKKEFSPEMELLLFEEPEAFLHPPQQNVLDTSLRQLASQPGRQVLAATHSPLFVSYNTDDIVDLVRLRKSNGKTDVAQITSDRLKEVFTENQSVKAIVEAAKKNAAPGTVAADHVEMEAVRHFLWLNPDRCGLFFAHFVLIVEGMSEQVLTNYLIKTGELAMPSKGVFVLDADGKYNVHRFVNLLGEFRIGHAVLHDLDSGKKGEAKAIQDGLNELIKKSKNDHTLAIDTLPDNLEAFLGLAVDEHNRWKKAAATFLAVQKGTVAATKLDAFEGMIEKLVSSFA